jgi:hypothetical protein
MHSSLALILSLFTTIYAFFLLGKRNNPLKTPYTFLLQERVSNIAYNIVNGMCRPINDQSAPVYITIGDGGNLEGLATA